MREYQLEVEGLRLVDDLVLDVEVIIAVVNDFEIAVRLNAERDDGQEYLLFVEEQLWRGGLAAQYQVEDEHALVLQLGVFNV